MKMPLLKPLPHRPPYTADGAIVASLPSTSAALMPGGFSRKDDVPYRVALGAAGLGLHWVENGSPSPVSLMGNVALYSPRWIRRGWQGTTQDRLLCPGPDASSLTN